MESKWLTLLAVLLTITYLFYVVVVVGLAITALVKLKEGDYFYSTALSAAVIMLLLLRSSVSGSKIRVD